MRREPGSRSPRKKMADGCWFFDPAYLAGAGAGAAEADSGAGAGGGALVALASAAAGAVVGVQVA
jgi:hypothetical protein